MSLIHTFSHRQDPIKLGTGYPLETEGAWRSGVLLPGMQSVTCSLNSLQSQDLNQIWLATKSGYFPLYHVTLWTCLASLSSASFHPVSPRPSLSLPTLCPFFSLLSYPVKGALCQDTDPKVRLSQACFPPVLGDLGQVI